jgi:HbrB-like
MNRIEETRLSLSSDEGSDSELSPIADIYPSTQEWIPPNPRSGTTPGGQFELPLPAATIPLVHASSTKSVERAPTIADAHFESSRKRASSEADQTKPTVKESARRALFSRPAKIMTNLAGGKDKDKNKSAEKDESPVSPTYFRPFASPSYLRPRHSHDESTHRNSSLGSLTMSSNNGGTTPDQNYPPPVLSPAQTTANVSTSSLKSQLFHRSRERKDSNPISIHSGSTVLSKQNSADSTISLGVVPPPSPSIYSGDKLSTSIPKAYSPQEIRQVSAGHYSTEGGLLDDPWPLLRARVLGLFHGEVMRVNVEELNKLVLYVSNW